MTLLAAGVIKYPARIKRAELLAARYPFSAEILTFYRHIAAFQKDFYESLPKAWGKRPVVPANGNLRSELNTSLLLPRFVNFISLVESYAPAPLATFANTLGKNTDRDLTATLEKFWKSGLRGALTTDETQESAHPDSLLEFLPRAFLQPYAEFVVGSMLPPNSSMTVCRCPRCDSLPLLGVLRPEGDGGKRFLHCSFCLQEWEFLRILCAHCGETREEKLAFYTAEQFPHIRIEACETCHFFLRTIDLTKDGNAIPIVDDLAAIPLILWTEEHGYTRIQANLLGT